MEKPSENKELQMNLKILDNRRAGCVSPEGIIKNMMLNSPESVRRGEIEKEMRHWKRKP